MRKIIVGAQVSLDGIMQAPGGPTEEPTKGFKFGGWAMACFDQEAGEEIGRLFSEPFDLLLGRKTYEIFAAYWPYYDQNADYGGIAKRFNEIKKYAVSRSGEVDTSWQGSVLLRDLAGIKRCATKTAPLLSSKAAPNSSTRCWPTTSSTRYPSSPSRLSSAAVKSCLPMALPRTPTS
jgi:dihydrofolate reductase